MIEVIGSPYLFQFNGLIKLGGLHCGRYLVSQAFQYSLLAGFKRISMTAMQPDRADYRTLGRQGYQDAGNHSRL